MYDPKISELTVSELQELIRSTVQEAVAEVIIEFSLAAELDEQLAREAEMTDLIRNTLHGTPHPAYMGMTKVDD
jgi:hypothetical protein